MTKILVDSELLEELAVELSSYSAESAEHYAAQVRSALSAPQQGVVAVVPLFPSVLSYSPGEWFKANTIDEMEAFYWSRLPAIRQAANKLYEQDRETHRLRGLLEEANAVIEAARDVVAWDWSENDSDCVADMKALSMALDDLTPNANVTGLAPAQEEK